MKQKRKLDVDALLAEARRNFAGKRGDRAMPLVERALASKPDHAEAHKLAAAIDLAAERHESALEHADVALGALKKDAWLWFAKARALISLERYDEADAALRRSRDIDPSDPGIYELEALLRRAQGNLDAALDALSGALALHPMRSTALAMKADVLLAQGKEDEALEAFRAAVRARDGGEVDERVALLQRFASILDERGNSEEADAARGLAKAMIKY